MTSRRFPAVTRDLALVLDRTVPAASVADAIRSAGPDTLESLVLFDVYEGDKVGCGTAQPGLAPRVPGAGPDTPGCGGGGGIGLDYR